VALWAGIGQAGWWRLYAGLGVRGARGFGGTWVSRDAETGMPIVQSRLRAQVFDGGCDI
jgi:hypothetical protein